MKRMLLVLTLCTVVSAGVIFPFFVIGERQGSGCCGGAMPVTHDMVMHLNQMEAFHQGLLAGRLYPRWNAATNRGFGAPTTLFYPPLTYYLTSLLYLVTGDWIMVIRLAYLLLMLSSGLSIFMLARRLIATGPALVAMCAYMVMPYHLLNHYQRGALAECFSFIWMPLVLTVIVDLISGEERCAKRRFLQVSCLALAWGAFVWSHPPTAYQFLLITLPVLTGIAVLKQRWKSLTLVGAGLVLGLTLSAAYLLPAVAEQGFVHADDVYLTWPYHESYVLDSQSTRYDHRNDDFVARIDRLWLFSLTALLVLGSLLWLISSARLTDGMDLKGKRCPWRVWLTGALWASFMMLSASRPIGRLIPGIGIGVFAWRMLAMTSIALAILFGYVAQACVQDRSPVTRGRQFVAVTVLAVCGLALLSVSFFYVVFPMYRAQAFVANPDHSNYSLVPRAGERKAPARPEVTFLNGDGTYTIERWDPEYRTLRMEMLQAGTVSFRTYNYPGWIVSTDTQPLVIKTGPSGEITTDLAAGSYHIILEFTRTRIRSWGLAVSSLGMIVVAIGLAFGCWKH